MKKRSNFQSKKGILTLASVSVLVLEQMGLQVMKTSDISLEESRSISVVSREERALGVPPTSPGTVRQSIKALHISSQYKRYHIQSTEAKCKTF